MSDQTTEPKGISTADTLARCVAALSLVCLIFVVIHGGWLAGFAALIACGGYAIMEGAIHARL